ncbi:hypothetical protein COOONC_22968 [Cooperia oncophora]
MLPGAETVFKDPVLIEKAKSERWFSLPYDSNPREIKFVKTTNVFMSEKYNYEKAKKICAKEKGQLLTVRSSKDKLNIAEAAQNLEMYNGRWCEEVPEIDDRAGSSWHPGMG